MQRFQALSKKNNGLLHTRTNSVETYIHSRCLSLDTEEGNDAVSYTPGSSEIGHPISESSSCKSLSIDYQSWVSDQASTSDVLTEYSSSDSQVNFLSSFVSIF